MWPPVANLFAVAERDPERLGEIEARLVASAEFAAVWRPAPGWVAGHAPLPGCEDERGLRDRGYAFVEGRDRLGGLEDLRWLERLGSLTDRPTHLAELPGDFSFVRFRSGGSASVVRACAGTAPLYVHRTASGGAAIGTLLSYFSGLLEVPFRPDWLMNACGSVCLSFIDGRTFVEGVSVLPRASHTEIAPAAPQHQTIYWDPRPADETGLSSDPAHAVELRSLLVERLGRDLDPGGGNLLALSGGIDSSSVGALAAGTLGAEVTAWTLLPPEGPERSRELSYIEPLVERFGIDSAYRRTLSLDGQAEWVERAPGLPFPVLHPILCELPHIHAEREVRVLVSGDFADHVCGHWVRIGDWARHTSAPELAAHPRSLPLGPRDYGRWARRRWLNLVRRPPLTNRKPLPAWAREDLRAEYEEWWDRRQASVARDPRPLRELAEHVAADSWLAMNWEATSPLGVRRSLPFFNREVLELAFRCHPRELLGPGVKLLLRHALRADVPSRHLDRPDKGAWPNLPEATLPERLTRVPADGASVAGAEGLAGAGWIPRAPEDASLFDILSLRRALRTVRYLGDLAGNAPV